MDLTPEILQTVEAGIVRAVQTDGFVKRLAEAIVLLQRQAEPYPGAIDPSQLGGGYVLVQPNPTAQGNLLVLSQKPLLEGQNINVVVLAKDSTKVGQPRLEGQELDNYSLALYVEERPGEIASRKVFRLQSLGDDGLMPELMRQLGQIPLRECAFFFMNFLQVKPNQESAG